MVVTSAVTHRQAVIADADWNINLNVGRATTGGRIMFDCTSATS
jgi:excinuclease UvrABC ATPase subunit